MKDGKYGMENSDDPGGWDGMVGELIRKVSFSGKSINVLENVHRDLDAISRTKASRKRQRVGMDRTISPD